ncbi:hypothetical protein [Phytohabitans suffuscus]|uniref:hypothetical protein n=1 Tax=Phytohabitans suffuscus TaxID=624315 RepID=UPI001565F6F5|nr:hypothetical protein [Phytohabitans suffuscus]
MWFGSGSRLCRPDLYKVIRELRPQARAEPLRAPTKRDTWLSDVDSYSGNAFAITSGGPRLAADKDVRVRQALADALASTEGKDFSGLRT